MTGQIQEANIGQDTAVGSWSARHARTLNRVLIADDDGGIRGLLQKLVRLSGFDATVVTNGADALRELASDSFDLLLLDLQMPQVGGLQVLREVRNAGLKTAVVIISGTSDVSTAVEAMRLGAMDYIVKPFLPDHCVGVLRRCFETLRAEKHEFALPRAQWRPALK